MFSQPTRSFKAQVVKQFIGVMVVIEQYLKSIVRPASSASVSYFRSSITSQTVLA